ncbi:25183_t:CDS:2, partial [Cetraspora pellucida]
KVVLISIIDIQIQAQVDLDEEPDIVKTDIIYNAKLIEKRILNFPNISIQISDDGFNCGHKVKHVLITFAILDNITNIYKPEYHYTLILYPIVIESFYLFVLGLMYQISPTFVHDAQYPKKNRKPPLFDMIPLDNWILTDTEKEKATKIISKDLAYFNEQQSTNQFIVAI